MNEKERLVIQKLIKKPWERRNDPLIEPKDITVPYEILQSELWGIPPREMEYDEASLRYFMAPLLADMSCNLRNAIGIPETNTIWSPDDVYGVQVTTGMVIKGELNIPVGVFTWRIKTAKNKKMFAVFVRAGDSYYLNYYPTNHPIGRDQRFFLSESAVIQGNMHDLPKLTLQRGYLPHHVSRKYPVGTETKDITDFLLHPLDTVLWCAIFPHF